MVHRGSLYCIRHSDSELDEALSDPVSSGRLERHAVQQWQEPPDICKSGVLLHTPRQVLSQTLGEQGKLPGRVGFFIF